MSSFPLNCYQHFSVFILSFSCPQVLTFSCLTVMYVTIYYFVSSNWGFIEFIFSRLVNFGKFSGIISSNTFLVPRFFFHPSFKILRIHNIEITDVIPVSITVLFFSNCLSLYSGFFIKISKPRTQELKQVDCKFKANLDY